MRFTRSILRRFATMVLAGLFLIAGTARDAWPTILPNERFDFAASSSTLGFGQAHNVELRAEAGKGLVVTATDRDPYFFSPPVSLRAARQGELVVRAAFEGPVRTLALFFVTDKSPNFGQDKVLSIPVRADGRERDYRIPAGSHALWQGTITRYRFDLEPGSGPGSIMRLASISYEYPQQPQLNPLRCTASVLAPGSTATLSLELENPTPNPIEALSIRLEPTTDAISIERPPRAPVRLAPNEGTTVTAVIRARREGVAVLDALLVRGEREVIARRSVAVCVIANGPDGKKFPYHGASVRPDGHPWALVGGMGKQVLAVYLDAGGGLAEWWTNQREGYVRAGRIFPLVSLLHGERDRRLELPRWREVPYDAAKPEFHLELVGDLGPPGQELAVVYVTIGPRGEPPVRIFIEARLEVKRPIHLRAFASPRLLVGDGTFGADRDEGLFPGLEYLEKGERSSSKLDYHTGEFLRTVPHPKKITLPLMALTQGNRLLMLQWENPQPKAEGLLAPAAGFASPNFVDGQQNHLMTLFRPSVPDEVAENEWEARTPILLKPGERLMLSYELDSRFGPDLHVADAIPRVAWQRYESHWPQPQKPPRDVEAERALCRTAYTDVVWREKERGWNHALPASATQWAPFPYTFNLQFLESERAELTSSPERNRISQVIEQAAARRREIGGGRPSAEDYYFVGDTLLASLDARQGQARGLMRQQRPDGSWGFDARDPQRAELGAEGQAEVGIVADHAIPILQYALMTGDREAEAAGLKALEHMKRYVIPRAAQVWEIPLHTPDIMGAARGATAYRLGYLMTGNEEYLTRMDYWLATGLPFVYFWGHPNWPYWHYATIPVFGPTHYRAPNWIGLPVQWCGLVYAEEALRCAPLLRPSSGTNGPNEPYKSYTSDFKPVAAGIVHSALWQQPIEGEYRALLPDSYAFAAKAGNGPFINPETILRPLWLLRGFDFRVNSVVVPRGADRSLRVSALAALNTAALTADRSLHATLSAVKELPFGVLVRGLKGAPLEVVWSGRAVARRDTLERNQEGWLYLADRGWLLLNLAGTGGRQELVVRISAE